MSALPAEPTLLDKVKAAYPPSFAAGQIPQGMITKGLEPLCEAITALQAQVKELAASVQALEDER